MRDSLRVLAVFACLMIVAGGALAQSQATTGIIEGTISDESGGVLPGVTVTMTNTDTGFERSTVTDGSGRFRGLLLPLGPYRVSAVLDGFTTLVREGMRVSLGQTITLQLTLQVEGTAESILVTGEAPVIETARTETQIRIDTRTIEGLPNNGRNFLEFSKLSPGVTIVQGPDGEELSINGQKGINNNVSVDGADFNNPFFGEQRGGQRPPFTFNMDAVQEVLVVTEGAPAEFGRSSGGFVNVVTKSGTNDLKGTAHVFYKDDSLASSPQKRDGTREPEFAFDQAQTGFTLGGPVVKDKIHFFLAYDLQKADQTKQTDPGRIDQRLVDFFASVGSPNENGPITRTDDADVALAKLDFQPSQKNLVTLRASYTYSQQKNGTFDVDQWGTSANAVETDYSYSGTTTVISSISDTFLNEFRGQYAKEFRPRPYDGPISSVTGRPFPDTAIAETGNRFGMPFFIPVEYNDDRLQLNNNLSILKGNHSIKAGIEYNDVASSQTFIGFANGRFIFSTIDDFIAYASNPNPPSDANGPVLLYLQFAGVGGLTPEQAGTQTLDQIETALFVQDSWQPRSNLTIDYGVRYEEIDQPGPSTPPSEVFYADFIGATSNGQRFPSNGVIPDDEVIEPRFALAWSPGDSGNSVVRATAGLYAARTPALTWASPRSTNGSIGQTLFRNSFLGGIGVLPDPPPWPGLIPDSQIGSPFQPDVFVPSEDFELPKTYAYSLSWEKEIAPDYALLIKGNYAKTDHITRWTNRNDPLLGSPWSTGLGPDGSNGVGALNTVESSARSRYYAFTIGINKRYSNNFQFQAYYTYSKDESDDDNERDPFTIRYANITNLGPEFGLSDRHQENRFNAWASFKLPWDIDTNIRISYRDAQPLDIRPDGEPVSAFPPVERCINGCTVGGDVFQRNQGEKDNEFKTLDVRFAKNFEIGDMTIQPIIDIFNLTDEANFLIPETTSLAFNFDGTVRSGAGEPREIQVGIRFVW